MLQGHEDVTRRKRVLTEMWATRAWPKLDKLFPVSFQRASSCEWIWYVFHGCLPWCLCRSVHWTLDCHFTIASTENLLCWRVAQCSACLSRITDPLVSTLHFGSSLCDGSGCCGIECLKGWSMRRVLLYVTK